MENKQIKQLKILMLGDSLRRQGGIVTVEKLMLEEAPPNIQIGHIGTVEDGSSIRKAALFWIALFKLVLYLLTKEVDIIHLHVAERGSAFRKSIITTLAKLVFKKPVILHSNSPEFHLFYEKLTQPIKQRLSWAFRKCDRFIAVSESWRNFYIKNLGLEPEQIVALANPIKLPEQVPLRKNSGKVSVVFLGRIGQRKGVFDLIQAFAMLPIENKNRAELILAGDGEVEKARELVESLNLTDYVTVFDWLDSEQRNTLLAKADIFVLPTYNEGLPLALLEAMSWSLPVISTPVGGIPDIITQNKNGLLVNPGDIKQLSEAIQCLIESEDLRLSLGRVARESVTPFDVKNYFSSLMDIYQSILGFSRS